MVESDFKPPVEDSYEDKQEYIKINIALDPYMNGANLLKVTSLLCLITQANRKKNPDFSVVDALDIICNDKGNKVYEYFKERLPLICGLFLEDADAKFESFGLKGKDEIVAEIKRLLDDWLPF
jgi:hypothetical protein